MRSWSLCFVALELLPHAFAFLAPVRLGSPAGGWVSRSIGSVISNSNRIMLRPQLSTVKMDASASSIESAVLKYKNFLGSKRWQDLGEPKAEAASVFEEICNIYGEENAIKMVSGLTCSHEILFNLQEHNMDTCELPPVPHTATSLTIQFLISHLFLMCRELS